MRPLRRVPAIVLLVAAGTSSCSDCISPPAVSCEQDADCPDGFGCQAAVCTAAAPVDGAAIDASASDRAASDRVANDRVAPDQVASDRVGLDLSLDRAVADSTRPDTNIPDRTADAGITDTLVDDVAAADRADAAAADQLAMDAFVDLCGNAKLDPGEACDGEPGCNSNGAGSGLNGGTVRFVAADCVVASETVNSGRYVVIP